MMLPILLKVKRFGPHLSVSAREERFLSREAQKRMNIIDNVKPAGRTP